jgi:hypothetical protein
MTMSEASQIRRLLLAQIPEESFLESWSGVPVAYQSFLDDAARRLAKHLPDQIEDLKAGIRSDGLQRIRLDGSALSDSQSLTFYAEIVWIPSSKTFRGNVSVRQTRPMPPEKTVDDFIATLDGIRDECETIFVGQVFNAMEGLDENDALISHAYPAIFRLFERFPEEDFGNPGHLVHLMLMRRGHESLLAESLRRAPSIPALELAYELAINSPTPSEQASWLEEVRRVAACKATLKLVREHAESLLN